MRFCGDEVWSFVGDLAAGSSCEDSDRCHWRVATLKYATMPASRKNVMLHSHREY
jgi:hypothetical protein